jgi:hypothetical protein
MFDMHACLVCICCHYWYKRHKHYQHATATAAAAADLCLLSLLNSIYPATSEHGLLFISHAHITNESVSSTPLLLQIKNLRALAAY